jgi:Helitron helicase-like domain at N-terminus
MRRGRPPAQVRRLFWARTPAVELENTVVCNDLGRMNVPCSFCHALHWDGEKLAKSTKTNPLFGSLCCHSGATELPPEEPAPDYLHRLLTSDRQDGKLFRDHVGTINKAFSFVSVGVKLDDAIMRASGPYCFHIQGELSHLIGSLCPVTLPEGPQPQPAFAQIYIHSGDSTEAITRRLQVSNLDAIYHDTFAKLQQMMHEYNPFVRVFKQAHQIISEKPHAEQLDITAALQLDPTTDRRRYNLPTVNEVATIIPQNSEEGSSKDLILRFQRGGIKQLYDTNATYQCLAYPLIFPLGQLGWHPEFPKSSLFFANLIDSSRFDDADDDQNDDDDAERSGQKKQTTVSRSQYYKYMLFARRGQQNNLLRMGKLYHQFVVDAWAVTEQSKLDFLKYNQATIRADLYKGVVDSIATEQPLEDAGQRFILPSTHINSTRHMFQLFQDSMAICRYFGHADLFITMTANPSWKEITDELYPGQTYSDRPDLVARVFQMKKQALLDLIRKDGIFGNHVASVWTVEFQKRGLPHVHLIVFLENRHKFRSPEDFENIIRADIPDPEKEPRLHALVTKTHDAHLQERSMS